MTRADWRILKMQEDHLPFIDERGFLRQSAIPLEFLGESKLYSPLPEPVRGWILKFETACVVDCCGIDACEFPPAEVSDPRWEANRSLEKLLMEEIERTKGFPAPVLVISELNQKFLKDDFLFLLKYLARGLADIRLRKAQDKAE